jgi:hypothetical protein
MIGNVASSGVTAGLNADKIRKQIQDIKTRTGDLKSSFQEVIHAEKGITSDLQIQMGADLDFLGDAHARLKVEQESYSTEIQNIRKYGIFFITAIFFILLLKLVGVIDWIDDLIGQMFNKVFYKNKST